MVVTCKKVFREVCFQECVDRGPTRASMKMYVGLVRAVIYYGCSSYVRASDSDSSAVLMCTVLYIPQ